MLPTTTYESNLGSQVARKFVNHRPTWLSCLSIEGDIKNLEFIFYPFLYENRCPIICALLKKKMLHFLKCKESGGRTTHSHRKWAVPFELPNKNTRHMVNVVSQITNCSVIIRAFRFERKEELVTYPHCILITWRPDIKLWEESATAEAIGMERR